MKLIGLEEHFVTPDVLSAWKALDPKYQDVALTHSDGGEIGRRLIDVGDERIGAMADTGFDVQVLSLTAPGVQNLEPTEAVALQTASNDFLAEKVRADPDRFQGFATLATPDPRAAARELERAIRQLGMNGAMLFGRTRERNLDHHDNWPVFEAAAALRAPLYLHPQSPLPAVREAIYGGFDEELNAAFATHGIGWHYETGLQILRMVVAGVFDRFRTSRSSRVIGERFAVLSRTDRIARKDGQAPAAGVRVFPPQRHRHAQWHVEPALPALGDRGPRRRAHHVLDGLSLSLHAGWRRPALP